MKLIDKAAHALALRWVAGRVRRARKEGTSTMRLLDGWKTAISAAAWVAVAAYASASGVDARPILEALLKALGWPATPSAVDLAWYAMLANTLLALWGIVSKFVKAWRQYKAGATPTELLSTEGYVKLAIDRGKAAPVWRG